MRNSHKLTIRHFFETTELDVKNKVDLVKLLIEYLIEIDKLGLWYKVKYVYPFGTYAEPLMLIYDWDEYDEYKTNT